MIIGSIFCCGTTIIAALVFYFYLFDYVKQYIPYFNQDVSVLTTKNAKQYFKQHPIIAGEIHYPRIPYQYWEHRIQMVKAMGINTLKVPVFWNHHEI